MKCHSKEIINSRQQITDRRKLSAIRYTLYAKTAFSLIEAITALAILALVSSSVLVVISRCMASAADSTLRMQAFDVARENMETLLLGDSVAEMAELGSSDKYPEIQWQTTVETFYEPLTSRMWIQAVCSAEYADTAGDVQTVELTHWLTDLTKNDILKILEEKQKELDEQDPDPPVDPNEPGPPEPPDPNEPGPPEPEVDCDTLPFCEMVECHLEAHTPGRPTLGELVRYMGECL